MTMSEIMRSHFLPAGGSSVEQHVEAHMVVLPHADGGAEKDEPAHQDNGAGFGPARRVVENVAAEDLPGDDGRHGDEPGTGDVEDRRVEPRQEGQAQSEFRGHRVWRLLSLQTERKGRTGGPQRACR